MSVKKKKSYGFKNLVKLEVDIINSKITIGRTAFCTFVQNFIFRFSAPVFPLFANFLFIG